MATRSLLHSVIHPPMHVCLHSATSWHYEYMGKISYLCQYDNTETSTSEEEYLVEAFNSASRYIDGVLYII